MLRYCPFGKVIGSYASQRTSNATIESFFRKVKHSELSEKSNLKPTRFLHVRRIDQLAIEEVYRREARKKECLDKEDDAFQQSFSQDSDQCSEISDFSENSKPASPSNISIENSNETDISEPHDISWTRTDTGDIDI